jgi:hypothetical protein
MKKSRIPSQGEAALALARIPIHWTAQYERTITAAKLGETFNPAFNAEFETIWQHALDHHRGNTTQSHDITSAAESTLFSSALHDRYNESPVFHHAREEHWHWKPRDQIR